MTAAIKAIPTTYNGVHFRSRLEARVAAAFDRYRIPYDYEPQAFDIDGVRYLPDFWLSAALAWIEVKPTWAAIHADEKAQALAAADFDTPVFYTYPYTSDMPEFNGRLHVVGARGGRGSVSSAVWSRCPGCNVLRPWNIGSKDYVRCCNQWFENDEWWDGHYGKNRRSDLVYGIRLPQHQDGRMIWSEGKA